MKRLCESVLSRIFVLGVLPVTCLVGSIVQAAEFQIVINKSKTPMEVTLENSQIKVVYAPVYYAHGDHKGYIQTAIHDFIIKQHNENIASKEGEFGVEHEREHLIDARIIQDGATKKTVFLSWAGRTKDGGLEQEVTIYRDGAFLEVKRLKWLFHVNDVCKAIGKGEGDFSIYGIDKWDRGVLLGFEPRFYDTYNNKDPQDGGPLNYDGFMILSAYHKTTGRGFGRVWPVQSVDWIHLINWEGTGWREKIGWEFFPYYKRPKPETGGFTCYLYAVDGGAQGALNFGKQIADFANGKPISEPVGEVFISPNGGIFSDSVKITLQSTPSDMKIHYTTDGAEPSQKSPVYQAAFWLKQTARVKAVAYTSTYHDSSLVARADFTIGSPASFTSADSVVAQKGQVFSYEVTYQNPFGGSVRVVYLHKPLWTSTTPTKILGTPTFVGLDSIVAVLKVDNVSCDTLRVLIHIKEETSISSFFPGFSDGTRLSVEAARGRAVFHIDLEKKGDLRLQVFDITGREVWKTYAGELQPGIHLLKWKMHEQSKAGVFLICLRHAGAERQQRVFIY